MRFQNKEKWCEYEPMRFQGHNSLGKFVLNMYAKCQRLDDGRKLFEEMPEETWFHGIRLPIEWTFLGRP